MAEAGVLGATTKTRHSGLNIVSNNWQGNVLITNSREVGYRLPLNSIVCLVQQDRNAVGFKIRCDQVVGTVTVQVG